MNCWRWKVRDRSDGFVLLEVAAATLLAGVLVLSLATALHASLSQGHAVRQQAQKQATGDGGYSTAAAWEWGPRVLAGWWRPGPVLHIRVSAATTAGQSGEAPAMGLWADGWLLEERTIEGTPTGVGASAGEIQIGPLEWNGLAGRELVVRVRAGGGAWGPPWRLALPDAPGLPPAPGAVDPVAAAARTIAVHRPQSGTSSLTGSWAVGEIVGPPLGLLFALDPRIWGWAGATLEERSQWWWMEEGRIVDVYF